MYIDVTDLEYASLADDTTPHTCLTEMIPILNNLTKVYRVCLISSQKTF